MSEPKVEPKKSKPKSSRSKQASGNSPRLKVVVRRLPPNLPEAIFWDSVSQWVTDQTTSWKLYVKGKLRTKLNKANVPSRAYVEFKTPEAVITFNQNYNGHVFRDKQGNETTTVVEYAPFQKAPHSTRKADAKIGTIETDEDYISFLNALNKPVEPAPDVNELITPAPSISEPTSTPLLDALKAAKESSTIKGYHSHYREQPNQPRTRAQQLEDEQTFNRKAPLLAKSQQDTEPSTTPSDPTSRDGKGKEKEGGGGGGGGKKKNKQKATAATSAASGSSPKAPVTTQSAPSTATARATAGEPRVRPIVASRGALLAALGAATESRATALPRKPSGKQREPPGSATNQEPAAPTSPLPAGVLAVSVPKVASEAPPTPGKGRRGGKNRGRGGNTGGSGARASTAEGNTAGGSVEGTGGAPVLSEMPRIDDPGQALPPSTTAPRGRGGRGRGRGGRGRGRGGAQSAGDQPNAPAT